MNKSLFKDIFLTSFLIGLFAVFASWYWNRPAFLPAAPVARSFVMLLSSPISLLSSDFLHSLEPTGCLDICIFPSLSQLLLYGLTHLISLTILSSICVIISSLFSKNAVYVKYPIRIGVLILIILLFHFYRQNACVNDYRNGIRHEGFDSVWHERYLTNTGTLIITGINNTFPKADELQKYFGISVVHSVSHGATVVRVPVGHEFEYACKLKNYSLLNGWVTPVNSSNLEVWRPYIDKSYWTTK